MKRTLPLLLATIGGLVMVVSSFVPAAQSWGETAALWFNILAAIAFVLGGANLFKVHLKAISDRVAGWGYSAIILLSFLATLAIGLLKVGVQPDVSTQWPGETWVPLPDAALPTARVPLAMGPKWQPPRDWPLTVREFLTLEDGSEGDATLVFRGYLSPEQKSDLLDLSRDVRWKAVVERLEEAASLPAGVQPFLRYRPAHRMLAAIGPLEVDQGKRADAVVPEDDPRYELWHAVMVDLVDASRETTAVTVPPNADIVQWPTGTFPVELKVEGDTRTLEITGPMTPPTRALLEEAGGLSRPAVPLPPGRVASTIAELEDANGGSLTTEQREIAERSLGEPFSGYDTVLALNAATGEETRPRTWQAIAADVEAGDRQPPQIEITQAAEVLTDEQAAVVERVVADGNVTADRLVGELEAAGPLSPRQATAVRDYFDALPTEAERDRDLALALLKAGSLSPAARDRLLDPYRRVRAWENTVQALDVRSQRIKYPWATAYNREGSAFWWIYEYLFKPLTATMFAMLAFYISSAAFRAFRAKNLEASLLLGTALIVLLGRISLGYLLTDFLDPEGPLAFLRLENLSERWIMAVFVTAGNRAIMIGIALGVVATSLKVLLGLDRSYLGAD